MYAVIKTGGKQYKVAKDDIIDVERLPGDPGAKVTFDTVLMVDGTVGTPVVEGASVTANVVGQIRDDKVLVFKKKRRQNYRRTKGHRQDLTRVQITAISAGGKGKAKAPAADAAAEG